MLRSQHRVYDGSGEVARTQDVWGAEGISGRVKFLPLAWAGMPKTSFSKNSDSPPFPKGILANFLHIAEMIEECGSALGLPYTKALGNGLFEIRTKGTEGIGRSFFCTVKNQEVIILHSFIKKSQKTPNREIGIARKRLKEVKS